MKRILLALMLSAGLLTSSACNHVGPRAMKMGGAAYNQALQQTTDQQLLLNIVRLKYRDNPSFMEIASVSTSYSLSHGASLGMGVNDSAHLGTLRLRSLAPSANISYAEKPTVTYQPLKGEKFVKQVLSPVDAETLLLLYHSGWSIERLARLCVTRLGSLKNAPSASGPTPARAPVFEEFRAISTHLRALQQKDLIQLARQQGDGATRVVLRVDPAAASDADFVALRSALGLAENHWSFPLDPSLEARADNKRIHIATRSLMGVLYYLSQAVEVPSGHQTEGLVTLTEGPMGVFDWGRVTSGLFRVRCGGDGSAALSVTHRGTRFWIEDSDLDSKSTFALLTQLMSLQSGNIPTNAPTLTLPIGGQ